MQINGRVKTLGMHVEVVTLIIPGVNDDEEALIGIAARCLKEVGPGVPLHLTSFYPAYKMTDRPPNACVDAG